ncbi:hypothetical protein BH24PSE2_BH24PSE2_23080 [soil metagenome]
MHRSPVFAVRGVMLLGALALGACATVAPENFKQSEPIVQPVDVSASRLDRDRVRPGRDIPQTLSPVTVITPEDAYGNGYTDLRRALQFLSPFTGGR